MNKSIKILIIVGAVLALTAIIVFGFTFKNLGGNNSNTGSTSSVISNNSSEGTIAQSETNIEVTYTNEETKGTYGDYTASINLSNMSASGTGVTISGTAIKITAAGTYYFTGTSSDANIVVEADKEADVILVFDNANITSTNTAVINGIKANTITVNLAEGSTNTFTDSSTYTVFTEDDEPNATVFSKTDLVINGSGKLIINANYKDGIASKDNLKIVNTNIQVTSADDGIRGKDSITIKNSNITINAKGDGIKATSEEAELGYIVIDGGTYTINSGDDGIHAVGMIVINDGTFNITAAEGIEATYIKINGGTINISASDDGINAANKSSYYSIAVEINGGYITIKMGAGDTDAIDSNGNIYINGGTIDITGNSAFDYDGKAEYNGGTLIVNGTQTNTITNQFMGGGMNGGRQMNQNGGMMQGDMPQGDPSQNGGMTQGGMGQGRGRR